MNVYDFDKTISYHDITAKFYFFCIRKNPLLLRYLPAQGFHFARFSLGFIKKTAFKERFYRFFRGIKDIDAYVSEFWAQNMSDVKQLYRDLHREDDVVISASPEFLLRPACDALGIKHLIASRVDKKTGKCTGENCYGEEKVLRFRAYFGDAEIDEFYSDSYSDTPLAKISKKAFLVSDDKLSDWDFSEAERRKK